MKNITRIILTLTIIGFTGCSQLTKIEPEYNLPAQALGESSNKNQTRVVFYNKSNPLLYGIDASGKIDIVLNQKNVASLNINEYVQIDLDAGAYNLNLTHYDVFKFSNDYTLEVSGEELFVKVFNQITSTNFEVEKDVSFSNLSNLEPSIKE